MSTDEAAAVADAEDVTAPYEPSIAGKRTSLRSRLAAITFASYLTVAFFILVHLGRDYWFYQDEWTVLLRRLTPAGLLRPLNQHWVTLPLVVFHLLFWAFGLNYRAYQLCTIILHLTLVVLLRLIMRRAGVGPWFATITASTFVLFGAGSLNIFQAIQMSLVGSVVLGILHLLCADHDGPFARRDALGLACGALGLMTSGIGTIMVVIVGIAVLIRRGWRLALLHTVPLILLDGVWFVGERAWENSPAKNLHGLGLTPSSAQHPLNVAFDWNTTGVGAVFSALGDYRVVAVALGALLVVGLFLAWRPLGFAEFRERASVPAALLLGLPVLFTLVSIQRAYLPEAGSSKFVHIATAFMLPALAIAAQAVASQWRRMTPIVIVLLLIGTPGNAAAFNAGRVFSPSFFEHEKQILLGAGYSALAEQVSRRVTPFNDPYGAKGVTVGFLLRARKAGRLPKPPPLSPAIRGELVIRLGVAQKFTRPPSHLICHRNPVRSLELHPAVGDVLVFNETMSITQHGAGTTFDPVKGTLIIQIQLPNLDLTVSPYYFLPFLLCK